MALVSEHAALRNTIAPEGDVPSVYACYRFAAKLRKFKPMLDACLDRLTASLGAEMPEMGRDVAIDASDLPAYANGQRYVSKGGRERERFSDQDASWGHRSAVSTRKGGGFYGFKVHAAVCTRTGLPLAWKVQTARENESMRGIRGCSRSALIQRDAGLHLPVGQRHLEALRLSGRTPCPSRRCPRRSRERGLPCR